MELRGLRQIGGLFGGLFDPSRKKATESSADRDAHSQSQSESRRHLRLTPEQVEEALQVLRQSLTGSGLSAEVLLAADETSLAQIVVKHPDGSVLRTLGHAVLVDLWLDRHQGQSAPGRLLSRSA